MTNTVHRGFRGLEERLRRLAECKAGNNDHSAARAYRRAARMVADERAMLVSMDAREGAEIPYESITEESKRLAGIAVDLIEAGHEGV